MIKKPKVFPTLPSILRISMKQKEEREIIKEFIRLKFTVQKFCSYKKLDEKRIKRLLHKYGIKQFYVQYTYKEIVDILREYLEVKRFYKKYILKKYDISYPRLLKWKKHFIIHKDKHGNVKLFLIDKEWDVYKDSLSQQANSECLNLENVSEIND